jgi:UDP:flavonoid glycosyltransferase YjiC (YdhE family)
MNVETLKQATIRALEDPVMRNRVKQVQRIVQREPGAEETVNRIEEYLEGCSAG